MSGKPTQTDKQYFLQMAHRFDLPIFFDRIDESNQEYIRCVLKAPKEAISLLGFMGLDMYFDEYENYLGYSDELQDNARFNPFIPKRDVLRQTEMPSYRLEERKQGDIVFVREGIYLNPINETYVCIKSEECKYLRSWGESGMILINPEGTSFLALEGDIMTQPTVERFER